MAPRATQLGETNKVHPSAVGQRPGGIWMTFGADVMIWLTVGEMGAIHRACRDLQRQFFDPPNFSDIGKYE